MAQNHSNTVIMDVANNDWPQITLWIKTKFETQKYYSEPLIHDLLRIIRRITGQFAWYNCLEAPIVEALTEVLKALRLYVTNEKAASYLLMQPSFFEIFDELVTCLFTKKNGPELHTKYLLQFFLNLLSVGNEEQKMHSRLKIRECFIKGVHLIFYNAYGHLYESSAVLYNIYFDIEIADEHIIEKIINYHADGPEINEYLDFLMEKIVSGNAVWLSYEHMLLPLRLKLLKCLREMCICDNLVVRVEQLPETGIQCLIDKFNKCSSIVFQVTQQGDSMAVAEVSYILEFLAHLSSNEKYLPYFQSDKNLLINAGVLLINVHRLGKSSNNVFTPIQKLSEIQKIKDDAERNPVFGFKADLVRLIGNLCWKNKRMQDMAREGDLIPVLLDSCNIDAKNPFIIQWAILAIRNVCENNRDNQAVIGSLAQQGVVSSEVLQEFGLTLQADDLSIGLVQLDINKQVN